jgi:hypothetical protein
MHVARLHGALPVAAGGPCMVVEVSLWLMTAVYPSLFAEVL